MARRGGPRSRCGTAARAECLAPHRGLSAGRRDAHTAVPRVVALCGVDGDGAVPASRGEARSTAGETRIGGCAGIARRADRCPRWPNWSAPIPGASACSRAAAAARAGSSSEPAARFVKPTLNGSRAWRSRENPACASTTASPAAATSRPTTARATRRLLLSDWSSLHLDLIAHDRGLKRLAASLYEFEPARPAVH